MAASDPPAGTFILREQVLHECIVMTRFALASGMAVPPAVVNTLENARFAPADQPMDMAPIVKAHDQLARLVAPATPRALMVLGHEHEQNRRLGWLGSVGLVRRMMGVAVVSILLFMGLSLTDATTFTMSGRVTMDNAAGLELLWNELFWVAAAGIGASFALLRQINEYIEARTYDPKYEPTYWIKFLLGVMAGYLMATLLPSAVDVDAANQDMLAMGLPTLAMLGGFSASAVYRILTKLVESVESIFRNSPRQEIVQREKAAQAKAADEISQNRLTVAGQIVRLQQQIAAGGDPATLSQALGGILGLLVPATAPADVPDAPAGEARTIALPNTRIAAAPDAPVATDADVAADTPSADAPSADTTPSAEGAPVAAGISADDEPRAVATG